MLLLVFVLCVAVAVLIYFVRAGGSGGCGVGVISLLPSFRFVMLCVAVVAGVGVGVALFVFGLLFLTLFAAAVVADVQPACLPATPPAAIAYLPPYLLQTACLPSYLLPPVIAFLLAVVVVPRPRGSAS